MNACWITVPAMAGERNLYFRARAVFELTEVPEAVALRIAAESLYRVWVNGQVAGAGPARGSRTVNYFDEFDITPLLRTGRNCIAVLVQCMNVPTFLATPFCGALCVEVEGITRTGDDLWEVRPAMDEWRADVEKFGPQTGFVEWRDLRREPKGWRAGEPGEGWLRPERVGAAEAMGGKRLLPRPVPLLIGSVSVPRSVVRVARVASLPDRNATDIAGCLSSEEHLPAEGGLVRSVQTLTQSGGQPVVISPPKDGGGVTLIFEFPGEVIGFFRMELSAPAGTIVDIGYDEELAGGRLLANRYQYRMADRFVLSAGRAVAGSCLHERGFRFVQVVVREFAHPVTVHAVQAEDRRYPASPRGAFHCSDALLNRLWEVCAETLSTCALDTFIDCPWRERSFWVNDLLIENRAWLQAFGDARLCAHSLRLALSNLRPDGWLPGVCPDDGSAGVVLVPTNLYPALMLRDYLLHTGDAELVRELLPAALQLIERVCAHLDADGSVRPPESHWNFLDWSYELHDISLNGRHTSMLEWIRCLALLDAAWLCEQLGDGSRASQLRSRVPEIFRGALRRFWPEGEKACCDWLESDGSRGADSSQLTHALAVLTGLLPQDRRAEAMAALENDALRTPELYLHHFLFDAWRQSGQARTAVERVRRYWGPMIEAGAATLWESAIHQQGKQALWGSGSLCHGFGASPIGVLQTMVLGVRPLEPGFRRFTVTPQACGLRFAAGRVPTPAGDIRVDWRAEESTLRVTLEVPAGLEAVTPDGRTFDAGLHEVLFPLSATATL